VLSFRHVLHDQNLSQYYEFEWLTLGRPRVYVGIRSGGKVAVPVDVFANLVQRPAQFQTGI
jgi:hypothetical protein